MEEFMIFMSLSFIFLSFFFFLLSHRAISKYRNFPLTHTSSAPSPYRPRKERMRRERKRGNGIMLFLVKLFHHHFSSLAPPIRGLVVQFEVAFISIYLRWRLVCLLSQPVSQPARKEKRRKETWWRGKLRWGDVRRGNSIPQWSDSKHIPTSFDDIVERWELGRRWLLAR